MIKAWFEVTSSAVTKTIRPMASELGLLRLLEDPRSGREKLVVLTDAGERFIGEMIDAGRRFLGDLATHLGNDELKGGITFLAKATEGIEHLRSEAAPPAPNRRRRAASPAGVG